MTTVLRQNYEEASGDLIAYTIGIDDDADIAGGEAVDTAAAPNRAYAVLSGDTVVLSGRLTLTGANASIDFTLPAELKPVQNEILPCVVNDGGVNKLGLISVVAATGVVAITMADAGAFAAADYVTLAGSYLRG